MFTNWAAVIADFNMGEGSHDIGNVLPPAGQNLHLHLHLLQINSGSSVVLAGSISL